MKFIYILIFSVLLFQDSFAQDFTSWNYQTECVDVSMKKATKIKVTNFDKKSKTDIDFEKKLGLHAVLIKRSFRWKRLCSSATTNFSR